jgi:hypothetical protein
MICLEAEALFPLIRIGKSTASVWGRLSFRPRSGAFPQNPPTIGNDLMVASQGIVDPAPKATFNAEAYRQEMTALVYQRSLERGLS